MVDFENIDKVYLGTTEIDKLYKGTELLYEKRVSPTTPYTLVGTGLVDDNGIISGFDGTNQVEIDAVPITQGRNIISFLFLPNESGTYGANQHLIRYGLKEGYTGASNAAQFRFTSSKSNSIWCRVGSSDSVYFSELTADNQPLYGVFIIDVTESNATATAYYSRTGLDSLTKCSSSFTFGLPDTWENRKWIFGQGSATSFLLGKIDMNYVSIQNGEGETWGTNFPVFPESGSGVRVQDGNLIFPEGLSVNIQNYETGSISPYNLPKNVTIIGANYYDEQFDDGTRFSLYSDMEGVTNDYVDRLNLIYRNYSYPTNKVYEQNISFTSVTVSQHYLGTGWSNVNPNLRYGIAAFNINKDANVLQLRLDNFISSSYLGGILGYSGIYLHDFGTESGGAYTISDAMYNYDVSNVWGKLSDDDIELTVTSSTSSYTIVRDTTLNLQAGHTYGVYALSSNTVSSSSAFSGKVACYRIYLTMYKEVPYDNYDKDMYITSDGYEYSGNRQVQINVSSNTYGTSLGMVKYNPTQGWYDLVPVN